MQARVRRKLRLRLNNIIIVNIVNILPIINRLSIVYIIESLFIIYWALLPSLTSARAAFTALAMSSLVIGVLDDSETA